MTTLRDRQDTWLKRARDISACFFYLSSRGHLVDGHALCYFCSDLAETVMFDPLTDVSHPVCSECAHHAANLGWGHEPILKEAI